MKKTVLLVSALAFVFSASILAETKVGVLDLNKVLSKSPQVAAMQAKLKKQFDPRGKALVSMQKSIRADVEKYNKDSHKMKGNALKAAQEKIVSEQKNMQEKQASFQHDLMAAQSKAMKSVLNKVQKVVKKIAADQKINLIVTKSSTAYNDPNLDITDQVASVLK